MAGIRLDAIEKTYPNGDRAVRGLDLEVGERELVVLVGPSGCGKSTVLRVVAGLESPSAGRVFIGERDVTGLPPGERDVAMVFQSYALYPHKNVRENLAFGLRVRRIARNEEARRVREVAARLGLEGVLERRPAELSGGQRQRVALGRALVREPLVFLLDEPLSNLDARLRVETRAEIARLHAATAAAMLYVTHDQEEAMTLGDRIAVLRAGRLEQVGAPLEVYRRPLTPFVAEFIGSPAISWLDASVAVHEGRRSLVGEDFRLDAPPGLHAGEGARVRVGVRPPEVAVVSRGEGDLRARVELAEPTGAQVLLRARRAGGAEIRVVSASEHAPRQGEEIALRLPRAALHVFDPVSGARVDEPPG